MKINVDTIIPYGILDVAGNGDMSLRNSSDTKPSFNLPGTGGIYPNF